MDSVHNQLKDKVFKRWELLRLSEEVYTRQLVDKIMNNLSNLLEDLSKVEKGTDFFRVLEKHKFIKDDMSVKDVANEIDDLSTMPAVPEQTIPEYNFDGTEKLLDVLCQKVNSKWEMIGAFLCIDFGVLEGIAANHKKVEERLRGVFEYKINGDSSLNWRLIRRALEYAKEQRLISTIEGEYTNITAGSSNYPEIEKPNWAFFIGYLSNEVSDFWKDLGRCLGINVLAVEGDDAYRLVENKAFAVLRKAYQSNENFNWAVISSALEKCNKNRLLRKINQLDEFDHLKM